jgi:hypothetical protein
MAQSLEFSTLSHSTAANHHPHNNRRLTSEQLL